MDFPIPPEFWWSTDNLSASIFLQGVDQKILPCGQGRIDSVKINPSLLMMTDCPVHRLIIIIKSSSSSVHPGTLPYSALLLVAVLRLTFSNYRLKQTTKLMY